MNTTPTRPLFALYTALLLVGTALAVWWAARTSPEEARNRGITPSEADYAITPPPLPEWSVPVIGVVGLLLALTGGALVIRELRAGRAAFAWGLTSFLLLPVALFGGLWWAIATAPAIGANIGLGLMLITLGPFALVFLLGAALTALLTRHHR
ncbi:hypothetical protein [Nocardiopsis sp. CC223A]|uniref:hypothetical protein n=1 Tax=Nocardiopsis sp. CC223A TaxID=3044051 RepID=UPI00278C2184|nr:hypothetical protein [Nocardiopsis sp. CC223A]